MPVERLTTTLGGKPLWPTIPKAKDKHFEAHTETPNDKSER
jgi:hypothetical protein